MSSQIVRYPDSASRYSWALGRSGAIWQSGLEVLHSFLTAGQVVIYPLTSKGKPSRSCRIDIPVESIDDVVSALLAAKRYTEAA